jgi:hypothetical protein
MFTCERSLDNRGTVRTRWLPWRLKYLNKDQCAQYQAGRIAFLEHLFSRLSILSLFGEISIIVRNEAGHRPCRISEVPRAQKEPPRGVKLRSEEGEGGMPWTQELLARLLF